MKRYPETLVQDGLIRVPDQLIDAYKEILLEYGIYDEALKKAPKGKVVGGSDRQETLEHLAHRFILSASRVQFVVLDPSNELSDISTDLRVSLTGGRVTLLDAPSGTGASLLGLLSVLAVLRDAGMGPSLPINITACCGDFSPTSQEIQSKLLEKLRPWLRSQAIVVELLQVTWDAARDDSTAALVDAWFEIAPEPYEHIVLTAAFSGVGAKNFPDFSSSFRHFTARLHSKLATLIWIEPGSNDGRSFIKKIGGLFSKIPWFSASPDKDVEAEFRWWHHLKLMSPTRPSPVIIRRYIRGDRSES